MQIKIKKKYQHLYPFMKEKGNINNIWNAEYDEDNDFLITTSGDHSYELIPKECAQVIFTSLQAKMVLQDMLVDIEKCDVIQKKFTDAIKESIGEKPTKDSKGKLFYEIDWEFIEGMAKRMELNKQNGKYDRFGWRDKGVDVTEMNQALIRHLIAILKGELQDDEQAYSHYYALACNSMLIINTLKKQNNNNQLSMEFDKIDKHSL